jgi:hypothetical protein
LADAKRGLRKFENNSATLAVDQMDHPPLRDCFIDGTRICEVPEELPEKGNRE